VALFRKLECWIDPVARDGPDAMAVDEWLCGAAAVPVLRVYRWLGEWCSIGYFGKLDEARARIDCPQHVRRITGGGFVDHRADWTYSLVVPRPDPVADLRGGESYLAIHQALVDALQTEGIICRLSTGEAVAGEAMCFANPVDHDVVGADGGKLAGAGQRRAANGLLHQGSVACAALGDASRARAMAFAMRLADRVETVDFEPDPEWVETMVRERYGCDGWTTRR
jgi:lipoate-protein ligase A